MVDVEETDRKTGGAEIGVEDHQGVLLARAGWHERAGRFGLFAGVGAAVGCLHGLAHGEGWILALRLGLLVTVVVVVECLEGTVCWFVWGEERRFEVVIEEIKN